MRLPDRLGFRGKTLWDWLQLLIVPAILIAITFAWSTLQTRSENQREEARIAADRAAAEEARQDATLQAYLDEMSGLMLHEGLLTSKKSDAVRAVARTVTLTALRLLDGERKAAVVRFLSEAQLLNTPIGGVPRIRLGGADLTGAHLSEAKLSDANLQGADLRNGDLRDASLGHAELARVNFKGANLSGAWLFHAHLSETNLSGANLRRSYLYGADLGAANLAGADLERAVLKVANLRYAVLKGANLKRAVLESATLDGANLDGANLRNAYLKYAVLQRARLANADLLGVDLTSASLQGVWTIDLDRYITKELPPNRKKAFLTSQWDYLVSLNADELSKFNLTEEKLAKFRREAGGP